MKLSVAVMAHPKRQQFIPSLVAKLGIGEDRVVWDQKNDRWDTGRRAMLHHDPQATHHLVIQDDALVPRDLIAGVERALDNIPHDGPTPMCLYVGNTTPHREWVVKVIAEANFQRASWLRMGLHWGVGIVMPTELIAPMVTWGDTDGARIANYDKRIGRWLGYQQIRCWYPWPSLVDHRQSPSLVPGRRWRGRRAHRWVGEHASALDVDWSGPVVDDMSMPRRQQMTKEEIAQRLEALGHKVDRRRSKAALEADLEAAHRPTRHQARQDRQGRPARRRPQPTPALRGGSTWSERVRAKQAARRARAGLPTDEPTADDPPAADGEGDPEVV